MSLFDLHDRVAVVTGSSRGIGRAIAAGLAEHGAKVAISSRKIDACRAVADELNAARPGCAIAHAANISSKGDLQALTDATVSAFGGVDVVVCNAATNPHFGPMSTMEDEQFRRVLDNNVVSNHWLIQMCVPHMVRRGRGSIIIVSSIGGLRGRPGLGAYNISKAADFQLARNLAGELGPQNIRANCIAPGVVRTDFARALWEDPEVARRIEQTSPLRRIGEPAEMAGAAVFLASDASSFMTGQSLVLDGGALLG